MRRDNFTNFKQFFINSGIIKDKEDIAFVILIVENNVSPIFVFSLIFKLIFNLRDDVLLILEDSFTTIY